MYAQLQAWGINPYFLFNEADKWMMDELSKYAPKGLKEHILSKAATNLWRFKRAFSPELPGEGLSMKKRFRPEENSDPNKRQKVDVEIEPDGTPVFKKPSLSKMSTKRKAPGADDEVEVVPPPARISKIIPDYFTINLPYTQSLALTFNAAFETPATSEVFRLNSIYDPYQTGAGHQPMGRDNWAALFQYWRVLKSEWKITFLNSSFNRSSATTVNTNAPTVGDYKTQAQQFQWGGFQLLEDTGNSITDTTVWFEGKQTAKCLLPPQPHPMSVNTLHFTYTPESWDYHVNQGDAEERWTPVTSDPAVIKYIAITSGMVKAVTAGENVATSAQTRVLVEVMYTVQFREAVTNVIQAQN